MTGDGDIELTKPEDEETVGFITEEEGGSEGARMTKELKKNFYEDSSDNGSKASSTIIKVVFTVLCIGLAIYSFVPSDTLQKMTNKNTTTPQGSSLETGGGSTAPVTEHNEDKKGKGSSTGAGSISSPHMNTYGGLLNMAHPAGAKAMPNIDDIQLPPPSIMPRAIPSLFKENVLNQWGHYVHDEHNSPFSSFLYDRPKEELDQEQEEYLTKMKKVREDWGAWSFRDTMPNRPVAYLHDDYFKDFSYKKLDDNVWQKDEKYVRGFLDEAKKLVKRVTEGIYAEYGHPTTDDMTEEDIETRNGLFGVKITEKGEKNLEGSAWLTQRAFDALVKKLLHAMITNDEFYVVLAGHSAAAGHGNMFHQDKIIQFHHLMEPVMDKLGVRLISRNLAMGGLGTLHYSLGAADLYGEKDILIWDSGMTERGAGDKDLFNKQNLLTGERVPILLTDDVYNLNEETDGELLHGNMIEQFGFMIEPTTDEIQGATLPWATQYLNCEGTGICSEPEYKFHGSCWVPRKDITPPRKQNGDVPSRAGWHPGDKHHRLQGRKISMMVLQALDKAFEVWEDAIEKDGFPLKESYWHIGSTYKHIQQCLSNHMRDDIAESECEKRFSYFKEACRKPMRGMGEFTPKGTDERSSIRSHLKSAPNGYVVQKFKNYYSGIDLLPPSDWKIPDGEIDVHAIAIATDYDAPELDQTWHEDVEATGDPDGDEGNNRRFLRQKVEEKITTEGVEDQAQISSIDEMTKQEDRELVTYDNEIIPGQGWIMNDVSAGRYSSGFCDGSSMSQCNRIESSQCFLYAHNDSRGEIQGDGLSGWLVINIPKLEHGIIFSKIEYWSPWVTKPNTENWTEVNNGKTKDTKPFFNETTGEPIDYSADDSDRRLTSSSSSTVQSNNHADYDNDSYNSFNPTYNQHQRGLKTPPPPLPDDMEFDIALNGKIIRTMKKEEFMSYAVEIAYNEAIWPLVNDDSYVFPNGVEFAVRLRSQSDPRTLAISFTHIYYS